MATMAENYEKDLATFFSSIRAWENAYADMSFGFIGAKRADTINILRGKLFLPQPTPALPVALWQTESLLAGRYTLAELGCTFEEITRKLASGVLRTPVGDVRLAPGREGETGLYIDRHSYPASGQRAVGKLVLTGAQNWYDTLDSDRAAGELREAERPYRDLNELAHEFLQAGLSRSGLGSNMATIEIYAPNVAEISPSGRVVDGHAKVGVGLSRSLDPRHCTLGYRVLVNGCVVDRSRISGGEDSFLWRGDGANHEGSVTIPVPSGALLQCFVSYAGRFQHEEWFGDKAAFPNPLRIAHSVFDADLQTLQRFLSNDGPRSQAARDFETGIANLLFMLGFLVDPLVGKLLEDAPDIIAATMAGDIALVECTTGGAIDRDGKLGKLFERAEMVRAQLKRASFDQLRVLPILVTPSPHSAVADTERARALGIAVLAREELEDAIEKTGLPHDANAFFSEAWESVQPQQELPGIQFPNLPNAF